VKKGRSRTKEEKRKSIRAPGSKDCREAGAKERKVGGTRGSSAEE